MRHLCQFSSFKLLVARQVVIKFATAKFIGKSQAAANGFLPVKKAPKHKTQTLTGPCSRPN